MASASARACGTRIAKLSTSLRSLRPSTSKVETQVLSRRHSSRSDAFSSAPRLGCMAGSLLMHMAPAATLMVSCSRTRATFFSLIVLADDEDGT